MKIRPRLPNILVLIFAGAMGNFFTSPAFAIPGDLYVSDLSTNSIVVYSHDGVKRTFATGLTNPQGLAFDDLGNLYVADGSSGIVYKYTRAGVRTVFASALANPTGLVVDGSAQALLVAENGSNVVWAYPLSGGARTASISGVSAPIGLDFDGINRYVANTGSVLHVAPDNTQTDIDPSDGSRDVRLDAEGDVLVSTDAGTITKLKPPTYTKTTFASGITDPRGLAFRPKRYSGDVDGVGNLLVADTAGGQILQYTVDGTRTTFVTGGNPNFLTFEVVLPTKSDFNEDGKSDLVWQNNITGERVIWIMNGTALLNTASLGIVGTGWDIRGTGEFNSNGKSDILWQNSATGQRVIWLMNDTTLANVVSLGVVGTTWDIVGSGDFDGDGKADILWENHVTGQRVIWLMNGTVISSTVSLGIVGTTWKIVGVGDFNSDGKADILWQNNTTGERVIWLMNGTAISSTVSLGIVGTVWQIAGTGDYNFDGKSDIVWQHSTTGQRVIWLMNGTTFSSTVSLGTVGTPWSIRNY